MKGEIKLGQSLGYKKKGKHRIIIFFDNPP